MPDRTGILGSWRTNGEMASRTQTAEQRNYKDKGGQIVLNPAYSIKPGQTCSIEKLLITNKNVRALMPLYATGYPRVVNGTTYNTIDDLAAAMVAGFTGVAIKSTGTYDTQIRDTQILGFGHGIKVDRLETDPVAPRPRIANVFIDCLNGVSWEQSTDFGYLENIHCWPFVTGGSGAAVAHTMRSGTAIRLGTRNDWTHVTNCSSWGYEIGFEVTGDTGACVLTSCFADTSASNSSATSCGFKIHSSDAAQGTRNTAIIGGRAAGYKTGIKIDINDPTRSVVQISDFAGWSNTVHIDLVDGTAIVSNPSFSGTTAFKLGANADKLSISNPYYHSVVTQIDNPNNRPVERLENYQLLSARNQANGYAGLDAGGRIASSTLPTNAFTTAGGALDGDLVFSAISDGITLGGGGRLTDEAGPHRTQLLVNGNRLEVKSEDGLQNILVADLSGPAFTFNGYTVHHAGNFDPATKLNLSGGILTGALTLNGAPSSDLHAATKKYVDDTFTGASAGYLVKANNLSDLADAGAARTNLGLPYKKVETIPLAGLSAVDLTVPAGATMVRITTFSQNTSGGALWMRFSGDGTTFLAGASDYSHANILANGGSVAAGAASSTNAISLNNPSDNNTTGAYPQLFQTIVSLTRQNTNGTFMVMSDSIGFDSTSNFRRSLWHGRIGPAVMTQLSLAKVRVLVSTGSWATGSQMFVEWF